MTPSLTVRWLCFAALVLVGGWIIVTRLSLSYDLAYFLPQPVTAAQRVLIDRVGQGPGSRILFVTLPGATAAERDRLAVALGALPEVRSVLPRELAVGAAAIPWPVLEQRYLLADVDTSVAGLRDALQARLRDLSLLDDPEFVQLIAADPHLASVQVVEDLAGQPPAAAYELDDGTPYLVLDTRPPAFDLGAQRALVAEVEGVAAPAGLQPELYGAGAYGIRLQQEVRRESTFFSLAAAAALAVLLWISYRGLRAVLLAAIPLAAGAVAGLAVLAAAFPAVHGITLAFGFTLMGVTIDYGLHVLSHARRGGAQSLAGVWPTLLLSAASTALAFLAFTLSGSRGLVQLGVFSAVGIVVAGFFAWFLLAPLAAGPARATAAAADAEPVRISFRYWPLLLCLLAGAGLLATRHAVWNDDLSSLTPVPPETLAADRRLRQQSNAPDIRHLLVSRGPDSATVLASVAELEHELAAARDAGIIDGYQTVTALLPDPATQRRRRAALQPDGLAARLRQAVAGLPLRAAALQPFLTDVERAASAETWVTLDSYAGSALADWIGGMLYRDADGHWVALTFLVGMDEPGALQAHLTQRAAAAAELVDLQAASRSLLATYRGRLLQILGGALLAVTGVLALGLGSPARLAWVVGTVVASVVLTTAVVSHLLGSLSLFDLVAATLVAGLGLDYALFFSRDGAHRDEYRDTRHALMVCFASTATVFGLLSLSAIPVLHGIGVTVTLGVVSAYVLAFTGRYPRPGT